MYTTDSFSWLFIAILLILGIVFAIAGILLARWKGASMGKYDIETISCLEAGKSCPWKDDEIQLRARESVIVYARLIFSAVVLGCVAAIVTSMWAGAVIEIIPSGIIAIYCWYSDWIEAYVSVEGISSKSPLESLIYRNCRRKKFVQWSEIASCDIVTLHSIYGKFIQRYPVLKDSSGKFVFNGERSFASQEDLDRLIKFIRGT